MKLRLLLLLMTCCFTMAGIAQDKPKSGLGKVINKTDSLLTKANGKINPSANTILLLSPINNAILSEKERLSGFIFNWSEVKASGKEPVSYRLKIWQAKNSQELKKVVLGKASFQIETLERIYNTGICDTMDKPCNCPGCVDRFYAWNIEAIQNGKIIATSSISYYSTTDAGCGTNKAAVKITCGKIIEGLQSYNVTVIFSNVVPAPGGQQCTTKMTGISSPTGITSSITTLPVIIPVGGSSPSVSFVYIPTNPAASTADFKYTGTWNDPDNNTSNFRTEKFELPRCSKPVNCCENAKWGTNKILNTHVASPLPACGADIGVMKCKEVKRLEFCFICPPGCDSAKLTYQIFPVNNNTPVSAGTLTNCALSPVTMPSVSGAYQIVVTPECNGVKCTPCKYNFKVDCEKPGDCCANSKWGDISYIKETGQTVGYPANGGNLGEFRCGSNLRTKVCYTCPPGCGVAQIRYDIYMVNSVLLVSSVTKPACSLENIPLPANGGVYQLIVTPICNGKECQGKDYIFTVKCPVETDCCTGGKWIPPFLPPPAPTPQNNLSYVVSIPANGSICGKDLQTVKCSTYMNFRFAYQCAATGNCPATITYVLINVNTNSVINTYANIANSSNLAVLAPPASGYYSMKAYAKCGDKICDSCTVNFKVECPASGDCCKGGYWMNLNIAKDQVNYVPMGACGSKIGDLKCNEKFKLNTEWECDEKCGQVTSSINYQIFNSTNSPIGTSTTAASGATVTLTAPSVSGNYYLKLVSKCGDKVCDSCKYFFTVTCPPPPGDCCKNSKWLSAQYQIVNKRTDGSWDYSNQTYYNLPLNGGVPLIKVDVGITVDNLKFQCNKGCESGFIIRRKNEVTGVFEPNEVLSNGKDDCSVYSRTYPQTVMIIPTCGGETCGEPIIFRIECLNRNCEIQKTDSCILQLIANGGFTENTIGGNMPIGSTNKWLNGYGTPIIDNSTNSGFIDNNEVLVSGNKIGGSAIIQNLGVTPIIANKKYAIQIGLKFNNSENIIDYGKIRLFAFNGTLPNSSTHPSPNSNLSLIGISGKIKDCGDWVYYEFPIWRANQNFQNFGISGFSNDNTTIKIHVDNITICETNLDPCDTSKIDQQTVNEIAANNPGICISEAEDENYFNGYLKDLYGYDGSLSMYQNNLIDCNNNIGDDIPDMQDPCDSLRLLGLYSEDCGNNTDSIENTIDIIDSLEWETLNTLDTLNNINCKLNPNQTNPENFKMAFKGRDIIFIHGIIDQHLQLKYENVAKNIAFGASTVPYDPNKQWPSDPVEFYTGYYKRSAVEYWKKHINTHLRGKGYKNRYLIVTYNSAQGIAAAQHSIASQIKQAMESGQGVVYDEQDKRRANCFGSQYIIVSTSEGSLVADELLKNINHQSPPNAFRKSGYIYQRCKGNFAIRGAFLGNNFLNVFIASTLFSPSIKRFAYDKYFGDQFADISSFNTNLPRIIRNSMLYQSSGIFVKSNRGLGKFISLSEKTTYTIASGHPSGFVQNQAPPMVKALIPGFDDYFLSFKSSAPELATSRVYMTYKRRKVFDLGIPVDRAIRYYLDQKSIVAGAGYGFHFGATPYLSPTGMVQPVSYVDPLSTTGNCRIYNFLQSSSQHQLSPDISYQSNQCDYEPTDGLFLSPNWEEQLVTVNNDHFGTNINPAIIALMGEEIRGRTINIPRIKIVRRKGMPRPTIFWVKKYIWKRTYHNLQNSCYTDIDYGYEFLFPY